MKIALTFLIMGIFLSGIGGNEQPPSKAEQWESQLNEWNSLSYRHVLNVDETKRLWEFQHRTVPSRIVPFRDLEFLDKKVVGGSIISRDYNGDLRAILSAADYGWFTQLQHFTRRPYLDVLEGFLTVSESRLWLANNRYEVQKNVDGVYVITSDDAHVEISNNAMIGLMRPIGAFVTVDEQGQLRVNPGEKR